MNKLVKFVVQGQAKPIEFESLLQGIKSHRSELHMPAKELPTTYDQAFIEYEILVIMAEPPTRELLNILDRRLRDVGGELVGEVRSRREAYLLIKDLKKIKKCQLDSVEQEKVWRKFKKEIKKEITPVLIFLVIIAIGWISYKVFPFLTVLAGIGLIYWILFAGLATNLANIFRR